MTLHEHLCTHHTVRLSNGVEVEKPDHNDQNWAFAVQQHEDAIEAIKVPNWMEFWGGLDSSFDHHDSEIVRNIQSEFKLRLSKPPRIEEFVAVGENGEVLEEPDIEDFVFESHPELEGNPKEYKDDEYEYAWDEYNAAQDNVIYEGWQMQGADKSVAIRSKDYKYMIIFYNEAVTLYSSDASRSQIETTEELNRNVQLYMKIK